MIKIIFAKYPPIMLQHLTDLKRGVWERNYIFGLWPTSISITLQTKFFIDKSFSITSIIKTLPGRAEYAYLIKCGGG